MVCGADCLVNALTVGAPLPRLPSVGAARAEAVVCRQLIAEPHGPSRPGSWFSIARLDARGNGQFGGPMTQFGVTEFGVMVDQACCESSTAM
jgi:hypothetical protein